MSKQLLKTFRLVRRKQRADLGTLLDDIIECLRSSSGENRLAQLLTLDVFLDMKATKGDVEARVAHAVATELIVSDITKLSRQASKSSGDRTYYEQIKKERLESRQRIGGTPEFDERVARLKDDIVRQAHRKE